MDHEARLWKIARGLIARHDERVDKRGPRVATVWVRVADTVKRLAGGGARRPADKPSPQPSLSDILDGTVTKAVMEADKIDRDHVEAVVRETKQKLEDR